MRVSGFHRRLRRLRDAPEIPPQCATSTEEHLQNTQNKTEAPNERAEHRPREPRLAGRRTCETSSGVSRIAGASQKHSHEDGSSADLRPMHFTSTTANTSCNHHSRRDTIAKSQPMRWYGAENFKELLSMRPNLTHAHPKLKVCITPQSRQEGRCLMCARRVPWPQFAHTHTHTPPPMSEESS